MDALLLIAGAAAVLGGIAVLVFRLKLGAWRHSPPWIFAGVLFSFGLFFLAWAVQRQLDPWSPLEWLMFLARMGGMAGVVVFALIGRKFGGSRG